MTHSSDVPPGRRLAATAGVFTAVTGAALLVTPERLGPVIGLLSGTPRWPWMAARAMSNVATAGFVLGRHPTIGRDATVSRARPAPERRSATPFRTVIRHRPAGSR